MAVKYKLIQRKDMSSDAGPGSKLYYAQAVSAGEMTLDELCEDIAESSTVTSADVFGMDPIQEPESRTYRPGWGIGKFPYDPWQFRRTDHRGV